MDRNKVKQKWTQVMYSYKPNRLDVNIQLCNFSKDIANP